MIDIEQLHDCYVKTNSKIVLLVVDGLGGLPDPETGKSELEVANLPNLDAMARESACGLTTPVLPGVAPGSGPGHLALFGYDPLKHVIGRGALEALGSGVELALGDLAARGNFCTVDGDGYLVDRRAGRIPTEFSAPLCERLNEIELPGVQVDVFPVQDYRFVLRLRGEGLTDAVTETDPQINGVPALPVRPIEPHAQRTADLVNEFVAKAAQVLAEEERGNMVLLRGWAQLPSLPSFGEVYRLDPGAIAAYPMYRGLATVANMRIIPTGHTFSDEVDTLHEEFDNHDFFFIHYKPSDAAGEDGNFEAKVKTLEDLDPLIPRIRELNPDVFMVAGDHATPAVMASHSWHPVPFMLHSNLTRGEGIPSFDERQCNLGSIGRIPATSIMLLAMSHSGKLTKYGPNLTVATETERSRMPETIVAGNWKMNTTLVEAKALAEGVLGLAQTVSGAEMVLCPPAVSLGVVSQAVAGSQIQVGAQNMHHEDSGAYTGEIAPPMLAGLCRYVILGHSERRQYFAENDEIVNRKVLAALRHGLRPILCVGETLEQRESGNAAQVVADQVTGGLAGTESLDISGVIVAYEPLWAIGTGQAATPEVASEIMGGAILDALKGLYGDESAQVPLLYGGSVNAGNITDFAAQASIHGALVGGASLQAESFVEIARLAGEAKSTTP